MATPTNKENTAIGTTTETPRMGTAPVMIKLTAQYLMGKYDYIKPCVDLQHSNLQKFMAGNSVVMFKTILKIGNCEESRLRFNG